MNIVNDPSSSGLLAGKTVAFVGRLASMPRRDAAQLVRQHGGTVVERPGPEVSVAVVGERGLPIATDGSSDDWFDGATREAAEQGRLEVLSETQFWERLGLVDPQADIHRLYTPALLAQLLNVPLAVIRRWHRRGLIVPARQVRKLPYFDFQEVATARRLAELLAAGVSPRVIEKKLEALGRYLPDVERPLTQLSVIVEGREILLRQGDGLLEPGGQLRFDFEAAETVPTAPPAHDLPPPPLVSLVAHRESAAAQAGPQEYCRLAAEMEEEGNLAAAAEMYHAAMAAGGPSAEICFQLAELLYRQGEVAAARERYYMAIELDEDYVEARANLGCVLAETGHPDLALAAFEGALRFHPDYADVHYHVARLLDELGQPDEALAHWQAFTRLAPDSPWADEARQRLDRGGAEPK
jgi:Tfp pilus assembly protein PilF/DNA-binding transcriptional MerR regulator